MKAFTLITILLFSILVGTLFAQNAITRGDYLEVTCTVIDSTDASKDTFAVNEPATYVLSIRNITDYPITYRYSSKVSGFFTVDLVPYYMVDNNTSSLSSIVLDSEGVLEAGAEMRSSKTVTMDKAGKYEFVVNPNFNFPKQYWPSTGPLYRVFTVGTEGAVTEEK